MQAPNVRYFVLIAALLAGAGVYAASGEPRGVGIAHWPANVELYTVNGWAVGREVVDEIPNHAGVVTRSVTREFRSADGATATLTVLSNQAPKLYGAGPEVPFLGGGYTVEPAPSNLAPPDGDGVSGLVALRGADQWLAMYAYGERRGLLGNGPLPWTLALFDGIFGRPNDYYKLYLMAHTDSADLNAWREVATLAHTLFPRIAAWYATA